jgi:hypothetical protein
MRQVGVFLQLPPPVKLTAMIYLHIVEIGFKHHNSNPSQKSIIETVSDE